MQIHPRKILDRARSPELNPVIAPPPIRRPLCERYDAGELRPGRAENAWGGVPPVLRLTRSLGVLVILAGLSAPVLALGAAQSVTLAWDPSSDPTVVGYHLYHGVTSRTYTNMVDVGNATSATISGLVEGTTYFIAVTAHNLLGLESNYSAELVYTAPAAPSTVQLRVTPFQQAILTVTGQVGHTYDILATQTFTAWTVIGTVTLGTSGSAEFPDPNAANLPARFYRTQDTQP